MVWCGRRLIVRVVLPMPSIVSGFEPRVKPRSTVNLNLYRRNGRSPRSAPDGISSVPADDPARSRLQQDVAHRRECPHGLTVALLLTNVDIVPRHEAARISLVDYLDAGEPFYVGHSEPARRNEAQRKSMLYRQRGAIHFVAE